MSAMWTAVKKSLSCKSYTSDVYEPKQTTIRNKNKTRNNCCKASLGDVRDQRSKKFKANPKSCSPMSIRSTDLINPFTQHVRLSINHSGGGSSPFLATGSPGAAVSRHFKGGLDSLPQSGEWVPRSSFRRRLSRDEFRLGGSFRPTTCHKCGETLTRQDAEEHHLSKHAVSEVLEGDSSRKIIEMIFRAGWTNLENQGRIERIVKVHNPQTKVAQFEEYREMVKIRANRLQYSQKHPRCLADGNELLRFYATTLACPLGRNRSSNLCTLEECNVCSILRNGFSSKRELDPSILGIFTTSTSESAYKSIEIDNKTSRKALIVCRVIAGRVHKPMVDNFHELGGGRRSAFDSLAGKMGNNNSHIEDLYLLNPTALLPCFVIVCK